MKRLLFLLLIFCQSMFVVMAQSNETIFFDTLTKASADGFIHSSFNEGKYIYLNGSSFSQKDPLPTITKMDTAGNVIWTAIDHDNYGRFGGYFGGDRYKATCRNTFKTGDKLFTIAQPFNVSNGPTEIWCISDSSGQLIWKAPFNTHISNIVDYNSNELLMVTFSTFHYDYYVISKTNGAVLFTRRLGPVPANIVNEANILVDAQMNVLVSWNDTCRKYRDSRLQQLVWTSRTTYFSNRVMIDKVVQDSARYIFTGRNNIRAVDSLTGNTVWFAHISVGFVLGVQSGGDGNPRDQLLRDSMFYVTWTSPFVGGVGLGRGFTLTAINKNTGVVRYNVAYDFLGVPPDQNPQLDDILDWPVAMAMDAHKNIYITGSYDRAPGMESTGNWGIMKINGWTGNKIYESTITADSSKRDDVSQGRFLYYFDGKMFSGGIVDKYVPFNLYSRPLVVSFDTLSTYHEKYRKPVNYTIRYPSALTGITPFGPNMMLLKKSGRSGIVEMRSAANQLLWSRVFASTTKFVVPQNLKALEDTAIAASFIIYEQDTSNKILQSIPDSLLFVRINAAGSLTFQHRIKYQPSDTLSALQINTDPLGKTNFIFRKKSGNFYSHAAYMLGSNASLITQLTNQERFDPDSVVIRTSPFRHYNGDTMVVYQTSFFISSSGIFFSSTQGPSGYSWYGQKPIRNFAKIYSTLKLDSTSFLVIGRDSSNQMRASRYNHRLPTALVWSHTQATNSTMFNADTSFSSIYSVSRNHSNNKVLLTKFNKATGSLNWNLEKSPALNTSLHPIDLCFDIVNHRFLVGGYIVDTALQGSINRYFLLKVDTLGNIVQDLERTGWQGKGETKINSVSVMQGGNEIFGGSLGTSQLGTVGFYNWSCPSSLNPTVSISATSTSICTGSNVTFTATPVNGGDAPAYQWQVNGNNTGTNSPVFSTTTLTNGAQVKVILTSNAACIQSPTTTSNTITVTVNNTVAPLLSIAGTTTVTAGQSTLITATPANGGTTPVYQWQDSTSSHTWLNIAGANNTAINYTPQANGDKIRCQLTSNAPCAAPLSVTSNTLIFTVNTVTALDPVNASNYGIISYPNPVTSNFTVDSLRLSDKWETLDIITADGKNVLAAVKINNRTRVTIDIARFPAGLYMVILRRKGKTPVYLELMKQ